VVADVHCRYLPFADAVSDSTVQCSGSAIYSVVICKYFLALAVAAAAVQVLLVTLWYVAGHCNCETSDVHHGDVSLSEAHFE
jgi:hypothetical protein